MFRTLIRYSQRFALLTLLVAMAAGVAMAQTQDKKATTANQPASKASANKPVKTDAQGVPFDKEELEKFKQKLLKFNPDNTGFRSPLTQAQIKTLAERTVKDGKGPITDKNINNADRAAVGKEVLILKGLAAPVKVQGIQVGEPNGAQADKKQKQEKVIADLDGSKAGTVGRSRGEAQGVAVGEPNGSRVRVRKPLSKEEIDEQARAIISGKALLADLFSADDQRAIDRRVNELLKEKPKEKKK